MKDIKDLQQKLVDSLPRIKRIIPLLFGMLLVVLYGFLIYRVNILNAAEPSADSISSQGSSSQVPRIDPAVLSQLQNLQDNSTNVKSLFESARNSPFQE